MRGQFVQVSADRKESPRRRPLGRRPFRAPNQGVESGLCGWTAGPGHAQKECLFTDTGMSRLSVSRSFEARVVGIPNHAQEFRSEIGCSLEPKPDIPRSFLVALLV